MMVVALAFLTATSALAVWQIFRLENEIKDKDRAISERDQVINRLTDVLYNQGMFDDMRKKINRLEGRE